VTRVPLIANLCFITHNRCNKKQNACAFAKPHNVYWSSATRTESKIVYFYSITNHTHKLLVEVVLLNSSSFRNRAIIRPQHKNSRNSVLLFPLFPSCDLIWHYDLKIVNTWHVIIIQAVSKEKQCHLHCSTTLYVLFEATVIILRDPKIKYIRIHLHTPVLKLWIINSPQFHKIWHKLIWIVLHT